MLNENAKAWVAALRSGEYQQTREVLFDGTGYCCLGVACELYGEAHGVGFEPYGDGWLFLGADDMLPEPVARWLGVRSAVGSFSPPMTAGHGSLAQLNDDAGYDFDEIADTVESEPRGLFGEPEGPFWKETP